MVTDFQIVALPQERFIHLFSMSDAELALHGARRLIVDNETDYPCRVSLMYAKIGEKVILTPFEHHEADSPFPTGGFFC